MGRVTARHLFDALERRCSILGRDASDLLHSYRAALEREAFASGLMLGIGLGMMIFALLRALFLP